ncbi:MAG: type II toxin-antitoxin system VapC family toxin [Actinomycetes bacterium]
MTAVLDASAVLALLYREPGHDQVADLIAGAVVCTVNWTEIVQKLAQRGHPDPAAAAEGVRSLGVHVQPFTPADAVCAGLLWPKTHGAGLSLGDRACLAVAQGIPEGVAVTADQAWVGLDIKVPVQLIR